MENVTPDQMARIHDFINLVGADSFNSRTPAGKTPSSLEEELVSRLPLYDESEIAHYTEQAMKIAAAKGLQFPDAQAFKAVTAFNPELGKKVREIGMINFQHMLQQSFYHSAAPMLLSREQNEFKASYNQQTKMRMGNINALMVEDYNYGGTASYRGLFYLLMRHLTNVTGAEDSARLEAKARNTFKGIKILELGCGPGFFVEFLASLGANAYGIERNEQLRTNPRVSKRVLFGDAKQASAIAGKGYNVVISKDFISLPVTRDDAPDILEAARQVQNPDALNIHSIDYTRMPEEKYFAMMDKAKPGVNFNLDNFKKNFYSQSPDQREMILRTNIFNIGPAHVERLGYHVIAFPRMDFENNLSMTMLKSNN